MEYNFANDMKMIRQISELTQTEFAQRLGVEQITISRTESGMTSPSEKLIEKIYEYAFQNNIDLGKLKTMFMLEELENGKKILFHGSKSEIIGDIDISKGRMNNDFGQGFYTGESYEQAVSFVSGFSNSSLYYIEFDDTDLSCKRYNADQEWMLTIAYNRGSLNQYKDNSDIKRIIEQSENADYIIAPIADNRMFQIINSFIDGEITDEQCKHCLAATNLGNQYVFKSEKAVKHLKLIEKNYISNSEKQYYADIREKDTKLGNDKVKMARIKYRGKGRYIDEIFV